MIAWSELTAALDEFNTIRNQLTESRTQERTSRFYHLIDRRQARNEDAFPVAHVIELSEGWCIVHWSHDPKSIALYSSILSLRAALVSDGRRLLSLTDTSERRQEFGEDARRTGTRAHLTDSERRIVALLPHGLANKEIGVRLGMAESTIKNKLSAIYKKLEVMDRVQAALIARDLNLDVEPFA